MSHRRGEKKEAVEKNYNFTLKSMLSELISSRDELKKQLESLNQAINALEWKMIDERD